MNRREALHLLEPVLNDVDLRALTLSRRVLPIYDEQDTITISCDVEVSNVSTRDIPGSRYR
jgi:hypothetical protein